MSVDYINLTMMMDTFTLTKTSKTVLFKDYDFVGKDRSSTSNFNTAHFAYEIVENGDQVVLWRIETMDAESDSTTSSDFPTTTLPVPCGVSAEWIAFNFLSRYHGEGKMVAMSALISEEGLSESLPDWLLHESLCIN